MEQLELEYLSKRDIKAIKKLDRLLRKSPYLRAFLDTLRSENEKIREENKSFKEAVLKGNKELGEKVETLLKKVDLKEEENSQILNEYLWGKVDDENARA